MDLAIVLVLLATVTFIAWIVDELVFAPKRRLTLATYLNEVGPAIDEDEVTRLENGDMAVLIFKYGLGAVWIWWLYQSITQGDIDFGLVLFILIVLTGITALLDHFWFITRRDNSVDGFGVSQQDSEKERVVEALTAEPLSVEYSKSFLPVLLIVFVLRSFLVEPFTIPSGSMLPTLDIGDYILVNKFAYGVRLPVVGTMVVEMDKPERGDVMVFKYPENPRINYIKRVVGVPGDVVKYKNKRLFINGKEMSTKFKMKYPPSNPQWRISEENLDGVVHDIQVSTLGDLGGGEWVVPEGHYFAMGDNRDNSRDSRAWGFVPDKYLVGKAFAVWMHKKPGLNLPDFGQARRIE